MVDAAIFLTRPKEQVFCQSKAAMPQKVSNCGECQYGFSDMHRDSMYDEQGRTLKARKTLAVINEYLARLGSRPEDMAIPDIGCSTGYLTKLYGKQFGRVTGIDIDGKAVEHAEAKHGSDTIHFLKRDSMATGLPDASFDVVTCTHVYEHVLDAQRLMAEIYRVLKPGGLCYFGVANRLQWMEPHYRLPLLSVIPKWLGHYYIRWAGKADFYYENHLTLWGLRRLVRRFEIIDYTRAVIGDPAAFCATDMLRPGSLKQKASLALLRLAYWSSPTYIWILKKSAAGEEM